MDPARLGYDRGQLRNHIGEQDQDADHEETDRRRTQKPYGPTVRLRFNISAFP